MSLSAVAPPVGRLITGNVALVAVSHGTSSPLGQRAVAALVDAVAHRLDETEVVGGFVDVQQPDVAASLSALVDQEAEIVVPLLLSAGYHVHVDLRRDVDDAAEVPTALTPALGPDDRLVQILIDRLTEVGLREDDVVVMAAAGSSDARAVRDCHDVADRLSWALGRRVRLGFISAAEPRLPDVVCAAVSEVSPARVVVASYLLAPGYFADLAADSTSGRVTRPLLTADTTPPDGLVDLVIDRFRTASRTLTGRL